MQLPQGAVFRGGSHSLRFRLLRSLDPQIAPTAAPRVLSRWAVYTTHRLAGYPLQDVASLRVRSGRLTRLDLHQLGCSLVRCSFPSTASRPACQAASSHVGVRLSLLPAYPHRGVVCAALRPLPPRHAWLALRPAAPGPPRAAVREAPPLYPRGPWLRSELCCLGPSPRTTTPSASLVGTRRLHGHAAYTPRLRCAGAPRRPTRPSLLSPLCCPHAPPTLHRWVPRALPLSCARRVPGCLGLSASRHPRGPVSASNI